MKVTKSLLAAGAAAVIGTAGLLGLRTAQAAPGGPNGMSDLVSAIAQKFNLNQDEVQSVFDQHRESMQAERRQEMETRLQERLQQSVTDGSLTQEQADKIMAKHEEMQSQMDSLAGSTPEEHRQAMQNKMTEMRNWAQENDIPLQYMPMNGGFGRHGGMHGSNGRMGGYRMMNFNNANAN